MMQKKTKEIKPVTLADVLLVREKRAEMQKKLLGEYNSTLISFTMNIAGPIKNTPLIERAFDFGLAEIYAKIPEDKILFEKITTDFLGCEEIMAVDMDAATVKEIAVKIEESSRLGRLFDIDVISADGKKLDRGLERGCIVCGRAGRECSAGRVHSADEIIEVTNKIMTEHFVLADAESLSKLACECLVREVTTTPKPGLVDLRNNGSHTDMNVDSFKKSAEALIPYFAECIKIGIGSKDCTPSFTFDRLREAGLVAEKTMYSVTNGVNTHKGAIYSMGVLLGAIGRLWEADEPIKSIDDILAESKKLVLESTASDLALARGATAGERLYISHGLKGIRGEVASGFSSVVKYSLPAYENALSAGLSENDAGVIALLTLIFEIDDTTLYHRGGEEGAKFAKEYAGKLLGEEFDISKIEKMDDEFIERNLSSGGAADLLAITCFLHELYQ